MCLFFGWWRGALAGVLVLTGSAATALASLPSFDGRVAKAGNQASLDLTVSDQAVLETSRLELSAGESIWIHQPARISVVKIVVHSSAPARVEGQIHADGVVILLSDSGWEIGARAMVSAAGISVVSPGGAVVNRGCLTAAGGDIRLAGGVIEQSGRLLADSQGAQTGAISVRAEERLRLGAASVISACGDRGSVVSPGGNVTLRSGQIFRDEPGSRIVTTGGGRGGDGGNVEVSAPDIESLDSGMDASAAAGWIAGGLLFDPINITLAGSGTTTSGAAPNSGGTVNGSANSTANWTLNVNTAFKNKNFSTITLEASGNIAVSANLSWDLSGANGYANGTQLNLLAGGNIIFGNNSSIVDENSWSISMMAGYNFTTRSIQSGTGSIYFNGGNNLTGGGYVQTTAGNISLLAGNDIQAYSGGAETLGGGYITATALAGNINISGPGYLSTRSGGNVTVTAGGSVYMGATSAGANVVNISSSLSGFGASYLYNGSYVSYLSGISTGGGGDVKIVAGGNIYSYLPTGNVAYNDSDPGSGAFGAGNVTLIADGNIAGHYQLFAGVGNIFAGYKTDGNGNPVADANATGSNAGSTSTPLALSLAGAPASQNGGTACGWNVHASQNIWLQEVRNPQGVFGDLNGAYTFNYAPDSYVTLTAGNQIQLGGTVACPRVSSNPGAEIPAIYPPSLTAQAGSGGVLLGANVMLYPSSQGTLQLTTLNGGPLAATDWNLATSAAANPKLDPAATGQFTLAMSDSSDTVFASPSSFTGHAATPIHAANSTAVLLNISGDLGNVVLNLPEAANVDVIGTMYNDGLIGQNLSSADATTVNVGAAAKSDLEQRGVLNSGTDSGLTVGGNIANFDVYQRIQIGYIPDFSQLQYAVINGQIQDLSALAALIKVNTTPVYDAATGQNDLYTLTYQGQMPQAYFNYLTSLQVAVLDESGNPKYDGGGNLITQGVQILHPADALALQTASQSSPASDPTPGFRMGGGGQLTIDAGNINLGSSPGIESVGPGTTGSYYYNPSLANYSSGANLRITAAGGLMVQDSTISCLPGATIDISAGEGVWGGLTAALAATNSTVLAGSNVTLTVNATGSGLITYQWFQNGAYLIGATNANLLLANVHRGEEGAYSVTVSSGSASTNLQAQVRVLAPQLLGQPLWQTNGSVLIPFGDADGDWLSTQDISSFVIQASPDLVNWNNLTNAIVPYGAGQLGFYDLILPGAPKMFYRVMEQ